ncbi:hypothetical protein LCGC14_0977660, partial [marine sediment metagenome]
MIRLAANLSMLFTEHGFMDRFAAAAAAGFRGVEYLFPYDYEASELRAVLDENQLTQVLFNLPPGNWDTGERGLASLPGREDEFLQILKSGKNDSGYDCIVPSSGGKDSHWQVLKLIELGVRPLVVTASTCHLTEIGRKNIDNLA